MQPMTMSLLLRVTKLSDTFSLSVSKKVTVARTSGHVVGG